MGNVSLLLGESYSSGTGEEYRCIAGNDGSYKIRTGCSYGILR